MPSMRRLDLSRVDIARNGPAMPANSPVCRTIPMIPRRHIIIPFVQISVSVGQRRPVIRTPMAKFIARIIGLMLVLSPALASAVFVVNFPWARPAGKGAATEVFMEITSTEGAALVGARSESAGSVVLVGPGAKAKPVERLMLPAGAPVVLAPGSYRVRLSALDHRLKLGDLVPLALIVEAADGGRQEIRVNAEVRHRSTVDDHLDPHHRH